MEESRTLADLHRDVDFANRYRTEYIKHMMSLSAGIFVISVAFMKEIIGGYSNSVFRYGLILGWLCLILSLIGGIFLMKCWDRFFISYRNPINEGKKKRKVINRWRIFSEACQITFFVLGLVLIFSFAALNLLK
jgi:hypothetical protein